MVLFILLFHFNALPEFTLQRSIRKSRFFALFCRFVRELFELWKLLQWTVICKVGMGFPTTVKLSPQLDPHLGVGNMKQLRLRLVG